jgi:MFS family permease
MLKNIVHRLLERRHFWRYATFSEIAELYASRMLRVLAINIVASFMSIFLYQNGHSIAFIALYWVIFFTFKAFAAIPLAALAAHVGAKHGILLANLLYIPSMIAFALAPTYGTWLLALVIFFQGTSAALYAIAYSVDFSKVKSVAHAGKEIAYMNIFEKITGGLSPLIGGVLAFLFGPQVVLLIAAVLFAVAAIPLLRTAEQELPRQRLQFRGFSWGLVRKTMLANMSVGYDAFTSGIAWTLFTSIFIIGVTATNEVYAISGALLSVVLFAALASSYAFGRLIDKRRGGELHRIATIGNAISHSLRAFITTPIGIAGINIANETVSTGYRMAYMRGVFDNADLSGQRTAYLGVIEVLGNVGAALGATALFFLVSAFESHQAMQIFFFTTAAVILLVATAKFPLYRK